MSAPQAGQQQVPRLQSRTMHFFGASACPLGMLCSFVHPSGVFCVHFFCSCPNRPCCSSLMGMLPLVLMFVVLWFVMIRPQMKKAKEHKAMIDALAKGDEVATAGGVLGKVAKLGDSFITLEISAGVEVQLQRSAVVQVLPKGSIK